MKKQLSVWEIIREFLNSQEKGKPILRTSLLNEIGKYYHPSDVSVLDFTLTPMSETKYRENYSYRYVCEILTILGKKGFIVYPPHERRIKGTIRVLKTIPKVPLVLIKRETITPTKKPVTPDPILPKKESFWKRFFNMIFPK